eukprot:6812025-Alexandrium_andersonii.AAC.1
MRTSGITELSFSRTADLEVCFPDQCQQVQVFGRALSTVRESVSLLRYTGPAEYLTMLAAWAATEVRQHAADLKRRRVQA